MQIDDLERTAEKKDKQLQDAIQKKIEIERKFSIKPTSFSFHFIICQGF